MSNPRPACGPVEGFVRPSLGFRCNKSILYTRGGQLVFDWDRLENFLITRDRPGGYKVTNTKYYEMQRFSFLFTF